TTTASARVGRQRPSMKRSTAIPRARPMRAANPSSFRAAVTSALRSAATWIRKPEVDRRSSSSTRARTRAARATALASGERKIRTRGPPPEQALPGGAGDAQAAQLVQRAGIFTYQEGAYHRAGAGPAGGHRESH